MLVTQRALALWEIASVLISCFIAEWVVLSLFGRDRWLVAVPISFALVLMIAFTKNRVLCAGLILGLDEEWHRRGCAGGQESASGRIRHF